MASKPVKPAKRKRPESLTRQVNRLAAHILVNYDGKHPSHSEGAIDTAMRIMTEHRQHEQTLAFVIRRERTRLAQIPVPVVELAQSIADEMRNKEGDGFLGTRETFAELYMALGAARDQIFAAPERDHLDRLLQVCRWIVRAGEKTGALTPSYAIATEIPGTGPETDAAAGPAATDQTAITREDNGR